MSFIKKINAFLLKWPGLMGLPFYFAFADTAVKARALNPAASLMDIGGLFYGNMANAVTNNLIPGAGIVLGEVFRIATDFVLPGIGTTVSAVFNAAAAATQAATPVVALTHGISP